MPAHVYTGVNNVLLAPCPLLINACYTAGVAVGTALGLAISSRLMGCSSSNTKRAKTSHLRVHVLVVSLEFASPADLQVWCGEFQALADKVHANEPNCLSYEVRTSSFVHISACTSLISPRSSPLH